MFILFIACLAAALMMVAGGLIFLKLNEKYPQSITLLTGLSGGFLLAIIFFGIIPEAHEMLEAASPQQVMWLLPLCVAAGAALIILFEKVLPVQHHHDLVDHEAEHHTHENLFYIVLAAFGLHSLFELLSVLIAGHADLTMGLLLALVIGIHNIPIGFIIMAQLQAVGCPIKRIIAGLGALAAIETALSVVCYLLLSAVITQALQGVLLGVTAGVMTYLLFDELLPSIYRDEEQHHASYAILLGTIVMFLFLNYIGG